MMDTIQSIERQVTTTTVSTTTLQRDGAMTIKRMKEMAEEQHHRNVGLQAANCHLSSQLKQMQDQMTQLKKAFHAERLACSDMKSKQKQLDNHIDDLNGLLEDIDVAHLKLSTNMSNCQSQQQEFVSKLSESFDQTGKIEALQKRNLQNYLDLEKRLTATNMEVIAAQRVNKDISNELVKCKTMISEKSNQLSKCHDQLDNSRLNQLKLESNLSVLKGKYDADMKQKDLDHTVLKQELSRTVNSLNSYLEQRQAEQEKKIQAEKLLRDEKEKVLTINKGVRKNVKDFLGSMLEAQKSHEITIQTRMGKWEGILVSFNNKIGDLSKVLERKGHQLERQDVSLKANQEVIKAINLDKDELAARVQELSLKLDTTSSELISKTAEADLATKEGREMQKQLKSMKEEQKQYCAALSNQNASELKKMKQKMKEEVENVKEKLQDQLQSKEKEVGALCEEKENLQQDMDRCVKEFEETKKNLESQAKQAKAAHQNELLDQRSKYDEEIKNLESDLAKANSKCSQIQKELESALAAAHQSKMEKGSGSGRLEKNDSLDEFPPSPPPPPPPTAAPRREANGKATRSKAIPDKRPKRHRVRAKQPPQKKQIACPSKKNRKDSPIVAKKKMPAKTHLKQKKCNFDDLFEDSLLDPYAF